MNTLKKLALIFGVGYACLIIFDFAYVRIMGQTPSQTLMTVVYSNITAASKLDGCDPVDPCIDNRSQFSRQSSQISYRATGSGSWSIDMQWADITPTVWTSFGSTAQVSNTLPSGIGFGLGPASIQKPYHDYIRFVITGNATIMNYTGTRQFWWLPAVASVAFPITVNQGGTPLLLMDGSGTTNNTAIFQAALNALPSGGGILYIPSGTYAICSVTYSGTGSIILYGDGAHRTMFVTHSSCLAQTSTMLNLFTNGNVYLHDFGIDSLVTTNTSSPLSGPDDIAISGETFSSAPASVTVDHLFVTHGQVTGLNCQPCQNVKITNSDFAFNWWQNLSIASGGTNDAPPYQASDYLHSYTFSGNTFRHSPIGLELNFLISDISESADTYTNSSLYLTQMPLAHYAGSGLTFNGSADYGCLAAQCGTTAIYAAVYNEGSSDVDLGDVHVANIQTNAVTTHIQAGVICQASNVSLGSGGTMELPCNDVHYHDMSLVSIAAVPVSNGGFSNGPNPQMSVRDSIVATKASQISGGVLCQSIGGVNGFDFSLNYCDSSQTGGFTVGSGQNGTIKSNYCHNCNTAGGTSYTTGTLTATNGSPSITGSGTVWTSGMVGGGITIQGTTYTILSRSSNTAITLVSPFIGTTGGGQSYSIYIGGGGNFAGLLINGGGTYNLQVNGNVFKSDSGNALGVGINDATGLTPAQSLITYDQTNSISGPGGLYTPLPTVLPTVTSCTNGAIDPSSTNSRGLIVFTGASTGCTIVFAAYPAFTGLTPSCMFTVGPGNGFAIGWGSGSGTASFVFQTAGNLSGQDVFYSCTGARVINQYPSVP